MIRSLVSDRSLPQGRENSTLLGFNSRCRAPKQGNARPDSAGPGVPFCCPQGRKSGSMLSISRSRLHCKSRPSKIEKAPGPNLASGLAPRSPKETWAPNSDRPDNPRVWRKFQIANHLAAFLRWAFLRPLLIAAALRSTLSLGRPLLSRRPIARRHPPRAGAQDPPSRMARAYRVTDRLGTRV